MIVKHLECSFLALRAQPPPAHIRYPQTQSSVRGGSAGVDTPASTLWTLDQAPDTIADTANSPDDADDVMLITKKREDVFRST